MIECTIGEIISFLKEHISSIETKIEDNSRRIIGYSTLYEYKQNTVTWVKNQEKIEGADLSSFALIVAQKGISLEAPNVIFTDESKKAFFSLIDELFDPLDNKYGIGANTIIGEDVCIDETVSIGCNCTIIGNITIAKGCTIGDNVVIRNSCEIGENTVIQPGCVIGIDGYGYYEDKNHRNKTMIRHHGGVKIGKNVFIGAHTNIARGTLEDTVICDDVKIAPSTHIGHNNIIEESASIICSNLYGSVIVHENAYLTSCTVKNQLTIGKDALVGMGAVVTKNVCDNSIVVGTPAKYLKNRYIYED